MKLRSDFLVWTVDWLGNSHIISEMLATQYELVGQTVLSKIGKLIGVYKPDESSLSSFFGEKQNIVLV